MLLETIHHRPESPYAYPLELDQLRVRIRTKKGEVSGCRVFHGDRYRSEEEEEEVLLTQTASDLWFDWFEGVIPAPTRRVQYVFRLDTEENTWWYGEKGISQERGAAGVFHYAYIHEEAVLRVPEWARDAAVYQIFPERFANGDAGLDPEGVLPWKSNTPPKSDSFYGGDLKGIIDRIPWLAELGVNTLYLTPIFRSPSNHKYNIDDYEQIDPGFGDWKTCKAMVETAHHYGIRVLFDGVFNHSGSGFFAFRDVQEKGAASPYKNWFRIRDFPVVMSPQPHYETFADHIPDMPKLMTHLPEVREYFLNVAEYWTREMGIDGWRLDVANEVDAAFWRAFRERIRSVNPDALIVGEIWHDPGPWLRGDQWDSVMNYRFREAVISFFATCEWTAEEFEARLTSARMGVPEQAASAMWNLLGSHDTERFLTRCNHDRKRFQLAVLFQMTYPGIPMIYYGDEVGMEGGPDPDCRRPMVWEEEKQDRELFDFHRKLLDLRHRLAPLRRGDYRTWKVDGKKGIYAFLRRYQEESVGVVINNGDRRRSIRLEGTAWGEGAVLLDPLSGGRFTVEEKHVFCTLDAGQGALLVPERAIK
ncbi:glycoside hydrolase family 13 protein [Paludifilum halophilum]|uniref:Alpha-glycosidase n=1 Tax=Paludifilum halophilum TaxID=1642702 RepID=A0A235B3I0_9BACL|nr:glycoside hydrolase family 13 protein [Paludifilum halophilum]OYD06467.1 alpha-glycosidase [Paludifilum halophilum]